MNVVIFVSIVFLCSDSFDIETVGRREKKKKTMHGSHTSGYWVGLVGPTCLELNQVQTMGSGQPLAGNLAQESKIRANKLLGFEWYFCLHMQTYLHHDRSAAHPKYYN